MVVCVCCRLMAFNVLFVKGGQGAVRKDNVADREWKQGRSESGVWRRTTWRQGLLHPAHRVLWCSGWHEDCQRRGIFRVSKFKNMFRTSYCWEENRGNPLVIQGKIALPAATSAGKIITCCKAGNGKLQIANCKLQIANWASSSPRPCKQVACCKVVKITDRRLFFEGEGAGQFLRENSCTVNTVQGKQCKGSHGENRASAFYYSGPVFDFKIILAQAVTH